MPIEKYGEFEDDLFINQNIVVDGNIVTEKRNEYVDFAISIGRVINI